MSNISIQNDCSLSCPVSVLKIEEYQRKGWSETEWGPVGLPGMEALLSPISCRQDSSLHDLPWVPKGRFEQRNVVFFEVRSPLCRPLPGKEIKLSFSTSPKTPSLRLHLAPAYREAEISTTESSSYLCSSPFDFMWFSQASSPYPRFHLFYLQLLTWCFILVKYLWLFSVPFLNSTIHFLVFIFCFCFCFVLFFVIELRHLFISVVFFKIQSIIFIFSLA